jgi:hypothetical protein
MKKLFLFSLVILFISVISAITFQNIFPTTTPYITNESTVNLSYGIHAEDGLSSITHSWNGSNTTLYDSSLVLFMNFDNRSELGENDTIVKDISGYGNNGTITRNGSVSNTTLVAGKYGNAYEFYSYAGDKISFSPINLTTEGTVAFWWKWKQGGTSEVVVLSNDNGYYSRILVSNTGWSWSVESDTNGVNILSGASVMAKTGWKLIVITKNGNVTKFYEDTNLTKTTEIATTNSLTLSTISAGDGNFFNGTIDNLMIWNRTLTQSEINYLYNFSLEKLNISYFEHNYTVINSIYFNQPSFLCTKNLTNDDFCSSINTIRQSNVVKSNFSTLGSIVSSESYGMNVLGQLGNNYYIDVDNDTILDTLSDSEWNRNAFLNSGLNLIRITMELSNCINTDLSINTTDLINSNLCNINSVKNQLEWANANNVSVLFIMNKIPYSMRNTTYYCNSSAWSTCTLQETQYANFSLVVKNYLEYVGCNKYPLTCKVSVGNEYESQGFWLNVLQPNLSNAGIRSTEANKFYNVSYQSVKAVNNSIQVGGMATHINEQFASTIWMNWLGNFTSQIDFFDFHSRSDVTQAVDGYTYSNITALYKLIEANLTYYGVNITDIYQSEYKYKNASVQNTSSLYPIWGNSLANVIIDTLNYNASRYNLVFYKWSSVNSYTTNQSEYPLNANALLEPLLGGQFYPPYNVTKNFAHLCPAGATVSVTSNDDATIKQVSCKKGNMYSLIVINIATTPKNITLNMSLTNGSVFFPYSKLTNYEDNSDTYTISSGITNLGILDSYEILYLTNDSQVPTITIDSPTNSTYLTSSNWFNISLDEDGSMCYYSLNDGANISLTQSGVLTDFYKYITGLTQIHNTVIFYCNDTYNNWGTASITFTASTPPTYTDNSVSNTIFGHNVKFEITVTDDVALEDNGQWIFSSDNTGEWKNDTAVNFSSTPETINVKKDIIKFSGDTLSYRWYFTDNAGNTNSTEIYSFTVSCEKETNVMYNLIMICASLLILSIFGFFGWKKVQEGEGVTVGEIIIMIIGISVCIALWLASGQTMGTVCGVIS